MSDGFDRRTAPDRTAAWRGKAVQAIAALLVISGAASGTLAYFLEQRHTLFTRGAATAEGRVVEVIADDRNVEDATVYFGKIEFRDAAGQAHRFRSRYGHSRRNQWRVGDRFDVLYRPERPQRAELKHEMPGMYGAFAIFAVIAIGAGLFLLIRKPTASAETTARTG